MLTIGSLCTGYGGLDMAVQSVVGGRLAWVSDILPASCTVLAAHHPDVPNLGDFTVTDWTTVERVDVFTAGYPCQPFSTAGKRKGTKDERHLWPYVRDAIRALRPRLAFLENVAGHLTLGFDVVLADLAALGMSARWGVVRASDAGAPHGRARLFIVAWFADAEDVGLERGGRARDWWARSSDDGGASADTDGSGLQGFGPAEPQRRPEPAIVAGNSVGGGHGLRVLPGGVGGVAPGATPDARERKRARRVADAAGDRDAPDAEGGGRGAGQGPCPHQAGREEPRAGDSRGPAADTADDARRVFDGDGGAAVPDAYDGADHGQWPRTESRPGSDVDWGKYGPAIHRWESVTGRRAPAPAVPGASGRDRLSPLFVEWMMGLPEGHVTGHGLSHGAELTLLGNGVVPQQAALALRMLLPHALTHAA